MLRRSGLGVVLAIAGLLLILMSVWVSSRDETQAVHESGPELGAPVLTPAQSEKSQASSKPTRSTTPRPAWRPAMPDKLSIPSISLREVPTQVGLTRGGDLEVPSSVQQIGWYRGGRMPGQPGNAIFTGHTWSAGDGVFDRLSELSEEDVIYINTAYGRQTYRVRSVGSLNPDEFEKSAPDIYRTRGYPGLILMTCGDWNASSSEYESTIVVFAELTS